LVRDRREPGLEHVHFPPFPLLLPVVVVVPSSPPTLSLHTIESLHHSERIADLDLIYGHVSQECVSQVKPKRYSTRTKAAPKKGRGRGRGKLKW
jgi:hypothetical protein